MLKRFEDMERKRKMTDLKKKIFQKNQKLEIKKIKLQS